MAKNVIMDEKSFIFVQIVPGPHAPWKESEAHFNGPIEAITTSETPFKRESEKHSLFMINS